MKPAVNQFFLITDFTWERCATICLTPISIWWQEYIVEDTGRVLYVKARTTRAFTDGRRKILVQNSNDMQDYIDLSRDREATFQTTNSGCPLKHWNSAGNVPPDLWWRVFSSCTVLGRHSTFRQRVNFDIGEESRSADISVCYSFYESPLQHVMSECRLEESSLLPSRKKIYSVTWKKDINNIIENDFCTDLLLIQCITKSLT